MEPVEEEEELLDMLQAQSKQREFEDSDSEDSTPGLGQAGTDETIDVTDDNQQERVLWSLPSW